MRSALLAAVLVALPALADTINAGSGLKLETVALLNSDGSPHTVNGPTDMAFLADGRVVITEKGGNVKVRATSGVITLAYRFCVDTASEKGLLGVVADPDFGNTRRLFFYYSNCMGDGGTDLNRHRVVSVTLRADSTLDPSTERVLLQDLFGPANHDGGGLAIGPDGKLYVGVGDTGCNEACCPAANTFSSCLSNGNGKILRINLDGTIPNDNPLVGQAMQTACGGGCRDVISATMTAPPRTEIWAWGLRNPWRFSFDPMTGKLWAGDVGEGDEEEIDIIEKGKHYGYPWFEGFQGNAGYTAARCEQVTPGSGDCVAPVWSCRHSDGNCSSITGGAFIDTVQMPPSYRGTYFFADNATGFFSVLRVNAARDGVTNQANAREVLGAFTNNQIAVSVRRGNDGMPYYVCLNGANLGAAGKIARVVPQAWDAGIGPIGAGGGAGGGSGGVGGGNGGVGGGATAGGAGGGGGMTGPGGCGCAAPGGALAFALIGLWAAARLRRRMG